MADTKGTLVLVEDDTVLSDMYLKKFELEGLQIERAADGEEGLALIKQVKPKLALVDIMMPKKNGLELVKELRADDDYKDVFIVMLTNVGEQSYMDEARQLGANEFLMKSEFTPGEVVQKAKAWLAELS